MTNYEVLKKPGMLAAFLYSKFNGFPCGWCGMRSFEECDCVDRSTGCGFDWDEKFKMANRYSLNRMAKEIDRAISGACDICPVMDTCLEDGGRCVDTITEWLVQDNFMYDICMTKEDGQESESDDYERGWEDGRKALREEIWEDDRDRLD